MLIMVVQSTRQTIWYGLLHMARYVRYYDALETRYRRHSFWINLLLGLSGTGVLATFLIPIHATLPHLLGAVVAVVTVVNLLHNPGGKVATINVICKDVGILEQDYRMLWDQIQLGQIGDTEALERSNAILKRVQDVGSRLSISTDTPLNQHCMEEVNVSEKARYHSAA